MSLFSDRAARLLQMQNTGQANTTQSMIQQLLNLGQSNAVSTLNAGQTNSLNALQGGYQTALPYYERARSAYDPYVSQGLDAWRSQGDAAGLGGAAGYDRATANFRASPGYQWQVGQALDQTNRAMAAAGQLQSGNAAVELQNRASNLADQEYGTYYDRLKGIADVGYNATGQQAGLDQATGQLGYGYGAGQADIYGNTARNVAGVYGNTATAGANAYSNMGQQLMDINKQAYQGGQNTEANKLNLILGLGSSLGTLGGALYGARQQPVAGTRIG